MLEIKDYVPRLLASDLLSVDIETAKGQITCIGFASDAEHAICIPFADDRKASKRYWSTAAKEIEAWQIVQQILESDTPKLGQNYAGYDAYWLLKLMGIRTMNLKHDTRLMHHALYPELPKDLGFMGATYTRQGPWKNWRSTHKDKRDD